MLLTCLMSFNWDRLNVLSSEVGVNRRERGRWVANSSSRWKGVSWVPHSYHYLFSISSTNKWSKYQQPYYWNPCCSLGVFNQPQSPESFPPIFKTKENHHQVALNHKQEMDQLGWNFLVTSCFTPVSSLILKKYNSLYYTMGLCCILHIALCQECKILSNIWSHFS